MSNEVKEAEIAAVVPESAVDITPPVGKFVGGEVRIIANAVNGSININAPKNLIISLAIIKAGEAKLMAKMQSLEITQGGAAISEGQFVGGEVVILADHIKGTVDIIAPENLIIAFAILEGGRGVLLNQMADAMRANSAARPPAIVPGSSNMLEMMNKLRKPS